MKFTTEIPANYSTDNINWFFIWHGPDPEAITEGIGWTPEGKMYRKQVPDESRRRGIGMPVPARMLGAYARYNTEGQHWQWCPMAEFAVAMQTALSSPPAQGNDELLAEIKRRDDIIEEHGKRVQEARKAAVQAQDAMDAVWGALA